MIMRRIKLEDIGTLVHIWNHLCSDPGIPISEPERVTKEIRQTSCETVAVPSSTLLRIGTHRIIGVMEETWQIMMRSS